MDFSSGKKTENNKSQKYESNSRPSNPRNQSSNSNQDFMYMAQPQKKNEITYVRVPEDKIYELEQNCSYLKKAKDELEREYSKKVTELNSLVFENEKIKKELEKIKISNDNLNKNISHKENTLQALKNENNEKEASEAKLKAIIIESEQSLTEKDQEINYLNETLKVQEKTQEDLNNINKILQASEENLTLINNNLSNEINELKAKNKSMNLKLCKVTENFDKLNSDNQLYSKEIQELKKKNESITLEYKKNEESLKCQNQSNTVELNKSIESLNLQIKEKTKEIRNMTKTVNILEKKLDDSINENKMLNKDLEQKKLSFEDLSKKLEIKVEENENISFLLNEKEEYMQELNNKFENKVNEVEENKFHLKQQEDLLGGIKTELELKIYEVQKSNNLLNQKEELLVKLKKEYEEKINEIQHYHSNILNQKDDNIETLMKKIENLQNELETIKLRTQSESSQLDRFKSILFDNNSNESDNENYDGVIVIDNFRDIMNKEKGWKILFPNIACNNPNKKVVDLSTLFGRIQNTVAFITITGSYDKGKTFLLNKICKKRYPSGKKSVTKGISFENTEISGVYMTIIDSAGSHSPIKMNEKIDDKKETEKRLRDIIFLLSDFFILVVNDYTTLDQEILEKLEKQLQGNKNKYNKEIIVIHNLKDVYDKAGQQDIWKKQIGSLYEFEENQGGAPENDPSKKNSTIDSSKRAKTHTGIIENTEFGNLEISYLKTQSSRHVMLINDLTQYGCVYNEQVIQMISGWIKTLCTSHVTKNFYEEFFNILSENLNISENKSCADPDTGGNPVFYNQKGLLVLGNNENTEMKIVCNDSRLNTILVEPNNFIPYIDIVENSDEYVILLDTPGTVSLKREHNKNKIRLRLERKAEYTEGFKSRERAFGEFIKEFKIPPHFTYENPKFTKIDGVLKISFLPREYSKEQDVKFD